MRDVLGVDSTLKRVTAKSGFLSCLEKTHYWDLNGPCPESGRSSVFCKDWAKSLRWSGVKPQN